VTLLDDVIAKLNDKPPAVRQQAIAGALKATAHLPWVPNPGPQTSAFYCEADELLFGGEAGGGKSDFLLGLALDNHQQSRILRRVNKDVSDLGERLVQIIGSGDGYNGQLHTWKGRGGKFIELAGCEQEKDKQRFKGKPRDLIGYDELADFLESQYVFINGWNRSTKPGQRCRVVGATNGPTTPEGQWILRRWAAWLDPNHPNPAKDGELRWFLEIDGKDTEVDGPGPHVIEGRRKPIKALSRTFIRSRLEDNPDLAKTNYEDKLEGLPEELRKVYREGDFTVGLKDDDWQVIPSAWIEAAMARWKPGIPRGETMTAQAVDIAQGGSDNTCESHRYGGWFAPLNVEPGTKTKEGRDVAVLVVKHRHNNCPVIIDVGGGWGGDALIACKANGIDVYAFNGVVKVTTRTRDGKMKFYNKRAESYWRFREELDPAQEGGSVIALPPDPLLKADLAAPHWKPTINGILLESKEEIKKRIGRSPDRGDAVTMCLSEGERAVLKNARIARGGSRSVNIGYAKLKQGPGYGHGR
jgi:hypothetical protein